MRFFNTEGPVNGEDHYCLPPLDRFDLDGILGLIAQKKYFILHAPRQTGKTSCLLALMAYLNQEGTYRALYANIEAAQAARENVEQGITAVVEAIGGQAKWHLKEEKTEILSWKILSEKSGLTALEEFLTAWCESHDKPTLLFLDEVAALVGDTLISLLRQLRSGYPKRHTHFPQSIILSGKYESR